MYRHIKTNFVQFLNFVESRFPPKKFYNIDSTTEFRNFFRRSLILTSFIIYVGTGRPNDSIVSRTAQNFSEILVKKIKQIQKLKKSFSRSDSTCFSRVKKGPIQCDQIGRVLKVLVRPILFQKLPK